MIKNLLISKKVYSILCLVLISKIVVGDNLPYISCPNYFSYEYDGNEYIGVIRINDPNDASSIRLDIAMTIGVETGSQSYGRLELKSDTANEIQERTLVYIVHFPPGSIPKLLQISVNNHVICTGTAVQSYYIKTIYLMHTVIKSVKYYSTPEIRPISSSTAIHDKTPFYGNNFYSSFTHNPDPFNYTSNQQKFMETTTFPPTFLTTSTQKPPVQKLPAQKETIISSNTAFRNEQQPVQCGVLAQQFQSVPLIVRGEDIQYGSWPWLVAIYSYTGITGDLKFICGGNLISPRAVLSAARCFINRNGIRISPNNCLVEFGRYNRGKAYENQMKKMVVSQIITHKDFMVDGSNGYDGDIGIVLLDADVVYTEYIRPICLPNQQQLMSGLIGIIVGWGLTETNQLSPIPKKTPAIIVTEAECIRSNNQMKPLISDRIFCAGYRNESGPCTGDLGGGLGIEIKGRWIISGIVSGTLASQGKCDLSQFVIYSDVSRYLDWIRQNIDL